MEKNIRNGFLSLVVISIVSAALWWGEVQWHGWGGLEWTRYFHLALPIGIALFLIWLNFYCGVSNLSKRITYLVAMAGLATVACLITDWSLRFHFGRHMELMFWMEEKNQTPWKMQMDSIYAIGPAFPLACLFVSWCFGVRFRWSSLLLGMGIYCLAVPLAIVLLILVNHEGTHDFIHTIKTGFCIPFLMVGLGVPFILQKPMMTDPSLGPKTA